MRPWLTGLVMLYAFLVLGVTLMNWSGPERWWIGSVNLYVPQWIWAAPGVLLFVAALRFGRRVAWVPVVLVAWVVGPLMGAAWPVLRPAPPAGSMRLRVMTYNVKYAPLGMDAMLDEILAQKPDLVLLQDAGGRRFPLALERALPGFYVRAWMQYVVASRYPVDLEQRVVPMAGMQGGTFSYVRCAVDAQGQPLVVYSAHALTPRLAWHEVKREGMSGIGGWSANVDTRMAQAAVIAEAAGKEKLPTLVVGDLNAPVQSLVCRRLFAAGFRDAFTEAGKGYGYTYGRYLPWRHSFLRIDHILMDGHWAATDCWAGGADGSEHCPVVADLALTVPRAQGGTRWRTSRRL